jgi:hypothetical protein
MLEDRPYLGIMLRILDVESAVQCLVLELVRTSQKYIRWELNQERHTRAWKMHTADLMQRGRLNWGAFDYCQYNVTSE